MLASRARSSSRQFAARHTPYRGGELIAFRCNPLPTDTILVATLGDLHARETFVDEESARGRIDTSVAHPARRYNYWLGGKDHFAADRESGDMLAAAFPTARVAALENRAFLRRTARFLAARRVSGSSSTSVPGCPAGQHPRDRPRIAPVPGDLRRQRPIVVG